MNEHAAPHKFIRPAEPTFGAIMLAELDAEEIAHELRIAKLSASATPRDMNQYGDRVRTAQLRLGALARRLGYDLVPSMSADVVDV